MWRLTLLFLVLCTPAVAQQPGPAPMSAIDWLSQSVAPAPPPVIEPATTQTAAVPEVTVTPLGRASSDPVGLLPSKVTGLPRTIWSASDEATLVQLTRAERVETLPAMQDLLTMLMLAEADPPMGAGAEGALFLARVDKLLDLGALEPAKSLIEQAGPDTPPLFRRWFDVALLTGTEDAACDVMLAKPAVAPTFPARIFCLARSGDWMAAALTLNIHRALGDISAEEEALLSRFLDPDLYEGEPPLPIPTRVSPLVFRMHEAIGEHLPTGNLPRAFAHADLRSTAGWKAQLEAAERLARHGAVAENVLQHLYTARTPAASGGVWDRAEAIQQFDTAMRTRDPVAISRSLPAAWAAMQHARTEVPFAKLYGIRLQGLPLQPDAAALAVQIGLLSPDYQTVAIAARHADPFLIALARGNPQDAPTSSPKGIAIQQAFNGAPPPRALQALVDDGKLGEALLRTIAMFHAGYAGDLPSITDSLSLLRAVGLEDIATRAALQLMILERVT